MNSINLNYRNSITNNLGTTTPLEACTCINCAYCLVCVLFPPAVGAALAPAVARFLLDTKNAIAS